MSTREPATALPRRRDGAATRERLMRAALELFTTQGYHGSTTPQIAERAGVAEGTIYRHFSSKQQLLNEVFRAAMGQLLGSLRSVSRDLPSRDRMERVASGWRDIAVREPSMVRLVFIVRVRGMLDQRSRESWQELRSEVESMIAAGETAGQIRSGPVDLWADIWLQLIALMLERVANREWQPDQSAAAQVIESAWVTMKA